MDPNAITAYAVTALILAAIVAGWAYLRRVLANDSTTQAAEYIRVLVKAAEQQFEANDERRAWVVAQVRERYPKIPIDMLLAVLEAAVYDLNQEQAIDAALEQQPTPVASAGTLRIDEDGKIWVDYGSDPEPGITGIAWGDA